ncbi:MAG: hypothetical protein WCT77_05760 [Bacteroidota bacterium]
MGTVNTDDLVFYLRKEDLQYEALEKIGRTLTDDEIHVAKKGLDWGLLTDIDVVYNTIFREMI